jgi:hypothetical protein
MSLMQMQYPGLTKQYYISSFIARLKEGITGLKEGIKHYLVPHSSQTLSDTYWQAKEWEKVILVKKSLLTTSPYPKPHTSFTATTTTKLNPPQPAPTIPKSLPNPIQAKPIPIKPREQGKCCGCQEPWTPEHKFSCKF